MKFTISTCIRSMTLLVAGALAFALAAPAQTFTVLYSFTGGADGAFPRAGLIRDAAGNLYGTTFRGGTGNSCFGGCGTVFEVTPTGMEKVLHSFTNSPDGEYPGASLVRDARGNLYSTTAYGGASGLYGTVFEITKPGKEKLLYSFTGRADGGYPAGGLVRDAKGNLYGTTGTGGASGMYGTVFKVTPNGNETVLYSFVGGADGANPSAGLVRDAKGNLYGTTFYGGTGNSCGYSCGTVFEVTADGTEKVLYSFTGSPDGEYPAAGLVLDAAGNLYGTTYYGGASGLYGYGTVFAVTPNGSETVLYSFTGGADGGNPSAGLVLDAAGNLYGTTNYGGAYNFGTVFEVTPTGTEKVLHSFTNSPDGEYPAAGLVRDAAGNLYGTTSRGGTYGYGVVFKIAP